MTRLHLLLALLLMVSGCASVPKESVELSRLVGEMAAAAKVSHINMTNRYFQHLRSQIENFVLHEYKETFLANVRRLEQQKNPAFQELTFDQYDRVIMRVQQNGGEWIQEIENDRQTVLQALEEHYMILSQANASVTALLQSVTKLAQMESVLLERLGPSVGISGTKIKEFEDKLLASSNRIREIMESALAAVKK